MSLFVNDSVPAIYISLADLPALLAGDIVGITLDQMDSLTAHKLDCDAANEAVIMYRERLDTAFTEIYKRDDQIRGYIALDDLNRREMENKNFLIREQDIYIGIIEKDLQKQKRKTVFAWILGGLGTGFMAYIALR